MSSFLERAGRWFLRSGIQEPGGGVARYYLVAEGRNRLVSTEITGYAVSALVWLHMRTGDGAYLDAAQRAGRFLARDAWDDRLGAMPFEFPVDGAVPEALTYFFDCGIIVRGQLALWRVTGDGEFLDAAVKTGRSMRAFLAGCEAHPILALPDRVPLPRDWRWSRSPGCYQLKSAMAWYDLFEATGESAFETLYDAALDEAVRGYGAFLPGHPDPERVMDRLHAFSYFLEGMLPRAARPDCAAAMCDGIARVGLHLRSIRPAFERSDVYAQLLRARLYADWGGIVPLDRAAAEEEAAELATFQIPDRGDPRFDGGFWFGRKHGEPLPFVNPVSAAFGLQALDLWDIHRRGEAPAHRHELI